MMFPPVFRINGKLFNKLPLEGSSPGLAAMTAAHHIEIGELRNVLIDLKEGDLEAASFIPALQKTGILEDCHVIVVEKGGNITDIEYGEEVPLPDER